LVQIGETYDDAEAAGLRLAHERGLPFISPYNDPDVIAGGGTVALEILEDVPSVRSFIVPAGGGGLISGVGVAANGLNVYGVQSEASPALHAALAAGRLVHVEVLPSLADGLAGNVESGSVTFELLQSHVKQVALVSEEAIARAMAWLALHEHVIVEGSAATGVAALLESAIAPPGPVAILLTGRNVASATFQAVVSKHLTTGVRSLNDRARRL
jgi:threonine dehydratase